MELQGKTALVTGGSIRVGRAIVLALAGRGCGVVIHYSRSSEAAEATRTEAEALGVNAWCLQADLTQAEDAKRLVGDATSKAGPLAILINNAAVFLSGNLQETSLDQWETQFALNLRAPFLLSQSFSEQVGQERAGRIVNILDSRTNRAGTDHFAYRLTKSALATMTENLALDLAPHITVNAVSPGAILAPPGEDESYLQRIAENRIPLARSGKAEMVGAEVVRLAEADFLTGTISRLDGGEFL